MHEDLQSEQVGFDEAGILRIAGVYMSRQGYSECDFMRSIFLCSDHPEMYSGTPWLANKLMAVYKVKCEFPIDRVYLYIDPYNYDLYCIDVSRPIGNLNNC